MPKRYTFSITEVDGVQTELEIVDAAGGRFACSFEELFAMVSQLPTVLRPISSFAELDRDIWYAGTDTQPTLRNLALDFCRVAAADLSHPLVVIEPLGLIDGTHRLVKAAAQGLDQVSCVTIPIEQLLAKPRR